MPTDTITLLGQVPLLRQFGQAELHLLYALGVERGIPRGTVLGRGGAHLDTLWIVLDGRIAVYSPLVAGGPLTMEGPAAWGSSALVEPFHSIGTATTETDCRVLALPSAEVRRLAEQNAHFGRRLYEAVASNVFRRLEALTEEATRR